MKTLPNAIKTLHSALNKLEEGVLAFTLLGLALMSFGAVVSRYVFNHAFTWFQEFSIYVTIFITFLGASLGVKYGLHFSMDYLVTRVGARAGRAMQALGALISAGLFVVVTYYGWKHTGRMYRFGTTSAAMKLPMYWAYLPIPLFSIFIALRFLHQAVVNGIGFAKGTPLEPPTPADQEAEDRV